MSLKSMIRHMKFLVGSPDQTEGILGFHLKRIVNGQEAVFTEREKERLNLYLGGAFDGEDEESGQGGEGKEEEDKDRDETEDDNEQDE